MGFPTEFPKDALGTVLKFDPKDTKHLVLAGYELVGYGLFLAFGDVKYLAGFNFDTLQSLAEASGTLEKATVRYAELKGSGMGVFLIVLKLVQEFGPSILALIKTIRGKLGE